MPDPLFTLLSYFNYLFTAQKAHGLHSPFVFELYNQVIKKNDPELSKALKTLRREFLNDSTVLSYTDPKSGRSNRKSVGAITNRSASSLKFQRFLIHLIDHLKASSVLEAGTSIGLNASALSRSSASKITTIEGSEPIANFARTKLSSTSARVISGSIYEVFETTYLQEKPDILFLDADHRKEAMDFYLGVLKKSPKLPQCIIIHDTYWSKEMNQAWKALTMDPEFKLTIDIFEAGLIFPHYPMEKQHFTLSF